MKYKVGDKVKIKDYSLIKERHDFLLSLSPPYVVNIKNIINSYLSDDDFIMYFLEEENEFLWYGHDIEGLWSGFRPVHDRWELLDL